MHVKRRIIINCSFGASVIVQVNYNDGRFGLGRLDQCQNDQVQMEASFPKISSKNMCRAVSSDIFPKTTDLDHGLCEEQLNRSGRGLVLPMNRRVKKSRLTRRCMICSFVKNTCTEMGHSFVPCLYFPLIRG